MQTRRKWLVFCCLIFAILALQSPNSVVPKANATGTQSDQTQLTWKDTLSGGLWAAINQVANRTAILSIANISSVLNAPLARAAASGDPPGLFTTNYRITTSNGAFPLEDEPSIAVTNQSGHVLMVVGANSLSTGLMPAYYSRDQGTTWIGPTYLPLSRANDSFTSDPGLAVNRTGTFFYSFLSIGNTFFGSGGQDDLVVATSKDGGNWTNHVAVQRRTLPIIRNGTIYYSNSELYDKPYIAVGPSPTNPLKDVVYVTYTDFTQSSCKENSTIMEVHSTDGGVTWSAPYAISPTVAIDSCSGPITSTGRLVQGSIPAVDPRNGGVYVAYYDTGKSGWLNGNATIMISKSTNGGGSFSQPVQAALIPQQVTYYSSNSGCIGLFCRPPFRWWSTMFPSMDVASDGTVYISYGAKQSMSSLDPADIFLVSSTNGGVTWSQRVKVNDNSSQNGAFFSWLKVSADGVVHIIWGDRRLDLVQIGYDVFYAEATSYGATISTNVRVTDIGTDPAYSPGFIGDYFNVAVSGNQVYPVWTDGRRGIRPFGRTLLEGETDIFTARLGPRTIPSVTMGASPAAGYQVPVPISGSGLPRDSFFTATMSGVTLNSQTYLNPIFFSDSTGVLSDVIIPNANYYGAYPIELDEWRSGLKLANTSLYIMDTRNLQVLVTGPASVHPGDSLIWNLQLIPASGSVSPQGISSTLSITKAQLTYPNGTIQDLTSSVTSAGPTSFTITARFSTSTALGSYILSIEGSQTGLTVQSQGIGTTTFTVNQQNTANSRTTSMTVSCTPSQVQVNQPVLCLATIIDTTQGETVTPTGNVAWATSGTGSFSAPQCTISGTGNTASCWVNYTPNKTGIEVITGTYSGSTIQPASAQPITLTVSQGNSLNTASSPQNSTLMLGLLTGGAGVIGLAAGAIVSILVSRRRKPNSISSSTPQQ